uniref:Possible internal protein n=1 Tax=Porcine epidemic diarrhea virus TaxID=28295 RepID=Q07503_PEDV|nr:possible internal protein [Porcine epidemic diarrhea virus]
MPLLGLLMTSPFLRYLQTTLYPLTRGIRTSKLGTGMSKFAGACAVVSELNNLPIGISTTSEQDLTATSVIGLVLRVFSGLLKKAQRLNPLIWVSERRLKSQSFQNSLNSSPV